MRNSLEEVAKRAAKGRLHPRVTTWARNTLEAARNNGEAVKTARQRAGVLLRAVQKKLWVPDPVGSEFIAGAHLLACDDESDGQVCIKAADCDELVVVLAATLLSVGIDTMIVGHAYDAQQRIEHVLCAVYLENKWHYADPSTQHPIGRCVPFSRERLLSMPNVQVLCDERACLSTRTFDPGDLNFVDKGVFVGVDGPPHTLEGLVANLAWIAEDSDYLGQVTVDLKDPATMVEVKRMMQLIKPDYKSTSPTWSPSDWVAYSLIVESMSSAQGFNKNGSVAYEEGGAVVSGKWPPPGVTGFPSLIGIQNMAEYLVALKLMTAAQVKTSFPKISSYGASATNVTAPVFGSSSIAKAKSSVSPLLIGALAAAGLLGVILVSSSRAPALSENRVREPVDESAADDLLLYLENDARYAPSSSTGIGRAVLVNQLKKWRKGTYNAALAPKAWMYVVEAAAKGYAAEMGDGAGSWSRLFNKPTREVVARELAQSFERDAKSGELDYIVT